MIDIPGRQTETDLVVTTVLWLNRTKVILRNVQGQKEDLIDERVDITQILFV